MKVMSSIRTVKIMKAIGMCVAFMLVFFGAMMIFMDILGPAEVIFETPHAKVSVRCFHVGIISIVLASMITITVISVKYKWTDEVTVTESPDLTRITTKKQTGMCDSIENDDNVT